MNTPPSPTTPASSTWGAGREDAVGLTEGVEARPAERAWLEETLAELFAAEATGDQRP